ncbi:MAG: glutamate--tRNA ligase [Alphaproteobacteria bacterium]|nr:glutamate--tRNA ligase [Alphaproteobacteria bacterium]
MTIVTRFPPSPTGFMHVGNARTALYNWLYAKHHGGRMLFRIEDTDRARHSEEAVVTLINDLRWLGLDWDGEIVSQYEQRDRHVAVAQELLAQGAAYYCYCTPEELADMREEAKAQGRPVAYDRRWRDQNADGKPRNGVNPVVRIKAPLDGETLIRDKVQGDVRVKNEQLDDFILLRSDGSPTYMLSVVVDDHDMGVTHVIRGDDHLNNTPRQKVIIDAMGWDVPAYAHLPMILGPDGKKMSKRHGAASVEEYREMGYLPEALCNYLLRLGWSHGDDEIISADQAVEWFDLDRVNQAAARFDFAKLESLNAHYIKEADDPRLLDLVLPILRARHCLDITEDDTAQKRFIAGMPELKDRAKTLLHLVDEGAFYGKKIPFSYDEKAQKALSGDAKTVLEALQKRFRGAPAFTEETVAAICKEVAQDLCAGKLGPVAMPLRAALTGTTVSPSIFHAAAILGQQETVERINAAVLGSLSSRECL